MMKQGILSWRYCTHPHPHPTPLSLPFSTTLIPHCPKPTFPTISFTLNSINERPLTARERRQLKNQRRQSKPAYNWKEDVEMRLINKPKTRRPTAKEELNLDSLALLGPQWWILRVAKVSAQEIAETLALKISQPFPTLDFKVSYPSVKIKRKLKNGTISVKSKPLFPGCVFLRCVMNRELHNFIREFQGVGGFLGTRVGNTKRQINKPKEVDEEDMEAIFKKAKEEQEKADQAFEEELQKDEALDSKNLGFESLLDSTKPGGRGRKSVKKATLKSGSTVRVTSGAFAGFSGTLKKLDKKAGLATVGFTLFGKETLADIDAKEVLPETDILTN